MTCRLRGITPHNFILTQEKKLLHSLKINLQRDIRLISIQEAPQGHLDLLFLVKGVSRVVISTLKKCQLLLDRMNEDIGYFL